MTPVQRVLATARSENGYLEKATNAQLEDKTANAGYNNWNKFAASWTISRSSTTARRMATHGATAS